MLTRITYQSFFKILILWTAAICCSIDSVAQNPEIIQALENAELIVDTQPKKVLALCDSLLDLEGVSDMDRTHIYYSINDAYYYLSDMKASYEAAKKGLSIMPSGFSKAKKVLFFNAQGQNMSFLGKSDSAIILYKFGLAVGKELADSTEISNLYFNIALEFNSQLNYTQALVYFDSSYQLNYITQDSFGLSHSLRAIGHVQSHYFEYEEAEKKYRDALKYVTDADPSQACVIYISLGSDFYKRGMIDSVKSCVQLASRCFNSVTDQNSLHYLYKLKGQYYIELKDTTRAKAALDTAISMAKKIGDVKEEINATFLRLKISTDLDEKLDFPKLLAFAKENNLHESLITGYIVYVQKLMIAKKYKEALGIKFQADQYLKEYNSQSSLRLAQTQAAKFELFKKENEIKLAHEKLKTERVSWLNYGLIGFGIVLGILAWLQYRNKRAKFLLKQEKLEKEKELLEEISDVESQAFRAQMNPHFIFNALNSIKGLVINQQNKEAALYISKFSKLVRMVLDNSRKKSISLDTEIETLELYLKLEQQRFRDGYDYKITIDESLESENIMIPPVIIQPFVENCIWHGFKNNPRENQLRIDIKQENEWLQIMIFDNGVGREASAKKNDSSKRKSHGIDITRQRLLNFSGLGSDSRIDYKNQLDDEGYVVGTMVRLKLPLKYQ